MTVRGIYSSLIFYPEVYTPPGTPIASYQNYSQTSLTETVGGITYAFDYRPFTVASIVSDSNSIAHEVSITFAATGAIIDFLETALVSRYQVVCFTNTWASPIDTVPLPLTGAGDPYAAFTGFVMDGETDFSTMTIRIGEYSNGTNADLPWRRIPWTILGPLSVRN